MTKIYCDACGKELEHEAERVVFAMKCSINQIDQDLCIVCATRIAAKINCFIKEIKGLEK